VATRTHDARQLGQRRAVVGDGAMVEDIGGDHRYAEGWAYGLADVWPERIRGVDRVANPGCFPAATLIALAPLLAGKLIEPGRIVVDAKTGVSGAGRGGGESKFGYAEVNEDLSPYAVLEHVHMPEIAKTIERLGDGGSAKGLVFTPHLVPMTRGILATCYARPVGDGLSTDLLLARYREFYAEEPFVVVTDEPPMTKSTMGSNAAHVSVRYDPRTNTVLAMGALDNLVKGASGQAVQCANLVLGLPETAGLSAIGLMP